MRLRRRSDDRDPEERRIPAEAMGGGLMLLAHKSKGPVDSGEVRSADGEQ